MFVRKFLIGLPLVSIVLCATSSLAQEFNLLKLKEELKLFSMALEERFGYRDGAALFGMNRGTVNSIYLYGQGILVEVRTPLANQRNRLQLTSLQSTIRALQVENPFEQFLLQNAPRGLTLRNNDDSDNFYQRLFDRIDTIESTLKFSRAVQQAADSARLLVDLENITEIEYDGLRAEIQSLQSRMNENVSTLKKLEEDLQASLLEERDDLEHKPEGSTASESYFNERLNTVITVL